MITIDQFKSVEMKVGYVQAAVNQEGSEKLIRLTVDFGEDHPRTIFTGVRPFGYEADYFVDKKWLFVTNLEPRKMMGLESQGMILAVDGPDGKPLFLTVDTQAPIGSSVR